MTFGESSARQTVHFKCEALFSQKKYKSSSSTILNVALRVNNSRVILFYNVKVEGSLFHLPYGSFPDCIPSLIFSLFMCHYFVTFLVFSLMVIPVLSPLFHRFLPNFKVLRFCVCYNASLPIVMHLDIYTIFNLNIGTP